MRRIHDEAMRENSPFIRKVRVSEGEKMVNDDD